MAVLKTNWANGQQYTAADQNATATQVNQNTTDIASRQPLDSDLTAIAGLSPSNDDVVQRKGGAWVNRTPAQLKTDLAIGLGDITGLTAALGGKQDTSARNQPNGYAGLDSSGQIAASQLPSYVDDVIEGANLAAFPGTGEGGKIYVALDTNKTYRWSGSTYVVISETLAIGTTSGTAKAGDYQPTWSEVTSKPAVIAAGADQAAARTAIGAVGTTDPRLSDARTPTDSSVTIAKVDPATLVTTAEGIASNNNDNTIPTSAAVKAYADAVGGGPGGEGGVVDSVVAGTNIDIDNSDPANPVISVEPLHTADITGLDAALAATVNTEGNQAISGNKAFLGDTQTRNLTVVNNDGDTARVTLYNSNADQGYEFGVNTGGVWSVWDTNHSKGPLKVLEDAGDGGLTIGPGTNWMEQQLDMDGHPILNVEDPTTPQGVATKAYTDAKVAAIVNSAPATLDTLDELAAALGDDPNFATTVSTNIGLRALKSTVIATGTGLNGGGDLSTNRTLSVAYGTTAGTAAQGNDARLSDARTPTAHSHNVVIPIEYEVHATYGTRAVGYGDNTLGFLVPSNFTLTGIVFRGETADASGSSTVELRKNGTQVTGTSKTITAANQWGYDGDIIVSGLSEALVAGDVLRPYISAIGTTPGKGLSVTLIGTKTVVSS